MMASTPDGEPASQPDDPSKNSAAKQSELRTATLANAPAIRITMGASKAERELRERWIKMGLIRET